MAIQCYRCPHDLSQTMSLMQNPAAFNNLCANPNETIDCSQDPNIGQSADACYTTVLSLNILGLGEVKGSLLNCTIKATCGSRKNQTCGDFESIFQGLPGFEMTNCDHTCCEGDLCNNPSKGSTTKSVAPTKSPPPITSSAHGPSNAVLSSIVWLICLALIKFY